MKGVSILSRFDPSRIIDGLEALPRYANIRQREHDAPTEFGVGRKCAREILEMVKDRNETRLGVEAMELLNAYDIGTPVGDIVDNPVDALEVAENIDGNVVMKIVSPDILHKSDIGGARVGVENEDVYDACEGLITHVKNYQPDANVLGVQVQEMVNLDGGVETIVGMNHDSQFGPLMMFGLDGIFVEVLGDTVFRVAFASETEAEGMTKEINAVPILRGACGNDPVDIGGITETIQRFSQLVTDFPAILEFDINPLVTLLDDVKAVDVRFIVDPGGF